MSGRAVVFSGAPTGQIARALAFQQAGKRDKAERIYRTVLEKDPGAVEAMHLLGLLEHEKGNTDIGMAWLRRAIQHRPTDGYLYLNIGVMLESRYCYPQAVAC